MESPTSFPSSASDSGDNDQSSILRNEAITIASFSIFLYLSVFLISMYYYNKFVQQEKDNILAAYQNIGKYDHAKKLFFLLLGISSFLEIPNYIGCLAGNGKTDCEWSSSDHLLFWFFHLIALCGYAYCIIIPCVLWSDMINKKDGKLFFSSYPYDNIKRYFQVLLILYVIDFLIDMIASLVYYQKSNGYYYREAPTYSICALIECILIVLISSGCLYCGIRLELYIYDTTLFANLSSSVERKFLFLLNLILFVITMSFCGRAVLILNFAPGIPESFHHPVNYAVYTLVARWTPDVFCQLLLVFIMRLTGKEIVAKNSNISFRQNAGTGYRQTQQQHDDSEEYYPNSDERATIEESLLSVYNLTKQLERIETANDSNSGSYSFRPEKFESVGSGAGGSSAKASTRSPSISQTPIKLETAQKVDDDVVSSVQSSENTRSDGSFALENRNPILPMENRMQTFTGDTRISSFDYNHEQVKK